MNYVFLASFIFFTAFHLVASFKKVRHLRVFSKGFIVFSLLAFYVTTAANPSWLVVIALLFSWIGDLLLIPHGTKWFVAGGISFMVSHLFFVFAYMDGIDFGKVNPWFIVLFACLYVSAVALIFVKLVPRLPKPLIAPMALYLCINGCMNCFAIFRLISNPCAATIITVVGAVSFFISDTMLYFLKFNKDFLLKSHFGVMLSYCLAEFLIVLGLIFF